MVNTKKEILKPLSKAFVALFLLVYPFGQLFRIVLIPGYQLNMPFIDLIALFSIPLTILIYRKNYRINIHLFGLLLIISFSLLLSVINLGADRVVEGGLYFLRLISYLSFSGLVYFVIQEKDSKSYFSPVNIIKLLIIVVCFIALLGWLQYFWFPDLRSLYYLGWDDHLYRLTGTFLDPGYTGILLVFGSLLALNLYLKERNVKILVVAAFLVVSLAFTYSRASYLALIAGVIFIYWNDLKKVLFYLGMGLVVAIILLPRPGGYGVRLERTHSIILKYDNYMETLKIFSQYSLFGVGYNNICAVRELVKSDKNTYGEHSCSGSDSSMLLLLATTGITGFMIAISFGASIIKSINKSRFNKYFYSIAVALFVHSLFLNSLFYAWVMGFVAIVYALALKNVKGYR